MNNLSIRQLNRLLKRYNLHDGDILALRYKTPTADTSVIEDISKALARMGMKNVLIVVVEDFNDLSVLNETEMAKQGWYHMKNLVKMMKLPQKEIE